MLQLQIEECHRDDVEALNDTLETTAAISITLSDKQDDPILEPELGTTPLWPNVVIHALYAERHEADHALDILSACYPHLTYSLHPVQEQDWERVCLDNIKPQQFGKRLWICPSWLTVPDNDAINITLDPGLAFGTGSHPTTALCLCWLEEASLNGKDIIDFGCGSGILAIAALKLGARHANAVDIDSQALVATKNNAENNAIDSSQLTTDFPEKLEAPVDILIANILLKPLMSLRERFQQLLKHDGILVTSGILSNQTEDLITHYRNHFEHVTTITNDEWALVMFRRIDQSV